jgi:uncharacterized protein YegL
MEGTKIGSVNDAIRSVLPELVTVGGSDVELKIACLNFSTGCQWLHPAPIPVEAFQWNYVTAGGVTDLGAACKELAAKLSKSGFLKAPSASVAPAIFLMSDGDATDDYDGGLRVLEKNDWFKYAVKVAVAIGSDANIDELAKFTGNREAVITVHTPEALKKMIRFVSVTSSKIASKPQPVNNGNPQSKQDAMIDQIKDITQADPDFSQTAPVADSW